MPEPDCRISGTGLSTLQTQPVEICLIDDKELQLCEELNLPYIYSTMHNEPYLALLRVDFTKLFHPSNISWKWKFWEFLYNQIDFLDTVVITPSLFDSLIGLLDVWKIDNNVVDEDIQVNLLAEELHSVFPNVKHFLFLSNLSETGNNDKGKIGKWNDKDVAYRQYKLVTSLRDLNREASIIQVDTCKIHPPNFSEEGKLDSNYLDLVVDLDVPSDLLNGYDTKTLEKVIYQRIKDKFQSNGILTIVSPPFISLLTSSATAAPLHHEKGARYQKLLDVVWMTLPSDATEGSSAAATVGMNAIDVKIWNADGKEDNHQILISSQLKEFLRWKERAAVLASSEREHDADVADSAASQEDYENKFDKHAFPFRFAKLHLFVKNTWK